MSRPDGQRPLRTRSTGLDRIVRRRTHATRPSCMAPDRPLPVPRFLCSSRESGASRSETFGRRARYVCEDVKTDAQLIKQAKRDPEALGELFRRHAPTVHRWLAGRTSAAIASELTAETFAQAALSLRRFRDDADGS